MTGKEYLESLRDLKTQVYMFGVREAQWVDHPILRPTLNAAAMTYNLAANAEGQELFTAFSAETGNRISRFSQLLTSGTDVQRKADMLRDISFRTATLSGRSPGLDALNAVFSATARIDEESGQTAYHENFRKYLTYIQESDFSVGGAAEDGGAVQSAFDGAGPLRIKERTDEGIVVSGCKRFPAGAFGSHEYLILPGGACDESQKNFAVAFAVPADAEGLFLLYGRRPSDTRRLEVYADTDVGNRAFGQQQALLFFDNVFVPHERVFLAGEAAYAGVLAQRFAEYRAHSLAAEKAGVGDALIAAVRLATEYGGTYYAQDVQDPLARMTELNETLFALVTACSAGTAPASGGNCKIDPVFTALLERPILRTPTKITHIALRIIAETLLSLPSKADFSADIPVQTAAGKTLGEWTAEAFRGAGAEAPERLRLLRLIEDICLGSGAAGYLAARVPRGWLSLHQALIERGTAEKAEARIKTLAGIQ
jgi:4-hydroxybutyryl-CoA dehydratase/vinylacetyl-CoA-Delta-isomerase